MNYHFKIEKGYVFDVLKMPLLPESFGMMSGL